jgi:transposase
VYTKNIAHKEKGSVSLTMKRQGKNQVTVTRIAILGANQINKWKLDELDLIASRLGKLRSDLWNEYGSLKAWGISKFDIDKQLRPGNAKYQLPAKLWEATLYSVIDDIHLVQASCIEKVIKALGQPYQTFQAKKGTLQLTLESREWLNHSRLCMLVRKYWYRGHTKVCNQIILKAYDTKFDDNNVVWLRFGGLEKGKTLKLPTTLLTEVKCQLRLIKRNGRWEIHYTTDIQKAEKKTEGNVIGVDRGYTEVYATSSNDGARFLGNDFGTIQTAETDYRTAKQIKRNKLQSVANKAISRGDTARADRINRNNLGRIKWDNREAAFKGRIKTLVFTATHSLMTNAIKVAYEDLTEQIKSKKPMKKRMKRNVSSWCKGIVADAMVQVSSRVGCTVVTVNCAYTSQLDSRFGTLTGTRLGDKFTGHDGVVMHSDINAADNVLVRMGDDEIPRYMKHTDVKVILLERTRKFQERLTQTIEVTQEVWNSVFEAVTGTDKPQTLDPKRKRTSKGNQRANYEQLTLFDFG